MEFKLINNDGENIIVYKYNDIFFVVERSPNWKGGITSKFYMENQLFLEIVQFPFLFKSRFSIKYQNLTTIIELVKGGIKVCDNIFTIKTQYFKKERYILFMNSLKIGEVNANHPNINFFIDKCYIVKFNFESDENFYSLISLIIMIRSTVA